MPPACRSYAGPPAAGVSSKVAAPREPPTGQQLEPIAAARQATAMVQRQWLARRGQPTESQAHCVRAACRHALARRRSPPGRAPRHGQRRGTGLLIKERTATTAAQTASSHNSRAHTGPGSAGTATCLPVQARTSHCHSCPSADPTSNSAGKRMSSWTVHARALSIRSLTRKTRSAESSTGGEDSIGHAGTLGGKGSGHVMEPPSCRSYRPAPSPLVQTLTAGIGSYTGCTPLVK